MSRPYYIFQGNSDCGKCDAARGVYSVHPGGPHSHCRCSVIRIDEGDCGNFHGRGEPWPDGTYGPRDAGEGRERWRIEVEVTKRDGSTETRIIEIEAPKDMNWEARLDAFHDAMEHAAEEIEDCDKAITEREKLCADKIRGDQ